MRIALVSPAADAETPGNLVTARRWACFLRELGHGVRGPESRDAGPGDGPEPADHRLRESDLLVALHARKSHRAVRRYDRLRPDGHVVVALTGTDLYRDLEDPDSVAWWCVDRADRLVVLQEEAPKALPADHRPKVRVIYQSVPELWDATETGEGDRGEPPASDAGTCRHEAGLPDDDGIREPFSVCMLAHLRPVKDPFLAPAACRLLPPDSAVRIHHFGSARSRQIEARARRESEASPRYAWRGELPHAEALERLRASRLFLLTSRMEGAGNATSEAITARIPVLCSRVPGLVGMMGVDYEGYFPAGDAGELARRLHRAETDPEFLERLRVQVERRRPLLDPDRERAAWASLLEELAPHGER